MKYIVAGKRFATLAEATAHAADIHRRTGIFVAVEHVIDSVTERRWRALLSNQVA